MFDNAFPDRISRTFKALVIPCILAAAFCGCSPIRPMTTPGENSPFMENLKVGKLSLNCQGPRCQWYWMNNFDRVVSLHNAGQWQELAELVMKIGYEVDLAYFFLGRSAEEMGYYDAAMKYYRYSLALYDDPEASHHCRTITLRDYCAGVNIGLAVPERIEAVQAKIDKSR